ncbi:leucine--tRNA ligase [Natrialba aegyptia]|uniref:Leucine--tRNA ligase n=1 Tax=Natrialba aegyptia DSM 13077 TaxID=1227491 RepID=M0B5M6_9EURY|nr:leucine--tRNA ligase [Natrialba aegyptia]ELZ05837.1 leucyl-tRNA ligase [Natrialba aegyptia DSM 13077]
MSYDPRELEAEWRERWAESGRYEADPDRRGADDATFVTVPYPYPSGGMHIGHARTYTVPDVYARYRRQQGDNVLFPIGWHVTGTPIVGAVERLKSGEEEQIHSLENAFGVPESDLTELETPMGYARYFIEEADCSYKTGMRRLGLSIDWRREFTTNDERYSKFITWQYEALRERGLLEKGLHPVNYCTNEEQPVTTHDLLEGEDAEFQEYTLIKFEDEDGGVVYPMATLRPETVRGVTNAYVDPDATYARVTVDVAEQRSNGSDSSDGSNGEEGKEGAGASSGGEEWIVSAEATEKLDLQARNVDVEETFEGAELVGECVANPVTDEEIIVVPANFVDTDNATGVVMSVPAHSPDDWIALKEAKARADDLTEYGLDPDEIQAIEPRAILTIEGYGEFPAKDAVEDHGVESSSDPALEEATRELYNREFHQGELIEEYGEFGGEGIEDVRDELESHFQRQGVFDAMYDFDEDVVCRCGGDVEVAEQETWFLRYNDEEWSETALRAIENLDAIPETTREQYTHTVDWLEEWPCIRNYGLGTRLPWDDEFVIEPLSDSTIYMAYYTIAHRLEDVPPEEMDRDFFETLFYGEDAVSDPDPDPDERALDLREEWDYWYPVDYRCSANDLISNHLTFFLYHHAELFDEDRWPKGITSMGMGLLEGEKMSSSKGHVVLPDEAIETYGADTVRFFLLNSSEPWQDFDWRASEVGSTRDQLERFWNRSVDVIEEPEGERNLETIDRWLLARLQRTVRTVTDAMERFETRTASQRAFYRFEEHLKWYRRRVNLYQRGADASPEHRAPEVSARRPGVRWTLRTVLETRLRLLAPFVPFMANELHERLTGEPAEDVPWPEPVPEFENPTVIERERLGKGVLEDVRDIIAVTDTDPETIRLYVAADWKRSVLDTVRDVGPDQGRVMGDVMQDEALREKGDAVNALVGDLVAFVRERDDSTLASLSEIDERAVYEGASGFLGREFDADVDVYDEDGDPVDPDGKASQAKPFRPAIHLE